MIVSLTIAKEVVTVNLKKNNMLWFRYNIPGSNAV